MSVLGEPVAVGHRTLRNRLVMTPHLGRLPASRLLGYVESRARAGVAMVTLPAGDAVYDLPLYRPEVIEAFATGRPDPDGITFGVATSGRRGVAGLWNVVLPALHERLVALGGAAQRHGALAVGQIHHPGAERSWDSFQPVLAPSPVRADASAEVPHAVTAPEVDQLVTAYVESAVCIVGAGLDGVELHAGHGYLLNRFLSPHYNRRVDEYGGSAAGRLRLLLRILTGIRARVGEDVLLGVRLPVGEELPRGLRSDDVAEIAAQLSPMVSYLSLSLGNHDGLRDGTPTTAYTAPWLVEAAPAAEAARAIRVAAACPVIVTGRVTTPEAAEQLVTSGAADLVGLARALIADPRFVARAIAGEADRIVACIGCNECTLTPFSCPVNPEAGRETQFPTGSALRRRRVLVVGAGPAGANAAARAAGRGHEVVLLDEAAEVGGTPGRLAGPGPTAQWQPLVDSLRRGVQRAGVDFRPGVRATIPVIGELDPDVVVLAVGAEPAPRALRGDRKVLAGSEVLAGATTRGTRGPVVVVGGREPHLEPFLVTEALIGGDHEVTLLSEHVGVGPGVEPRTLNQYLHRLLRCGVRLLPMTRALAWQDGMLRTRQLYAGREEVLEAAVVVVIEERRAADELAQQIRIDFGSGLELHLVGDVLAPRRFAHAALEGARIGSVL